MRFYIYTRYKLGIRARPIHEELVKAYCDHAASFRAIARWIQHFADVRKSVENEQRPDVLKTGFR
jgi:hypothetical protein